MDRESGFYWIKQVGQWQIAAWHQDTKDWEILGSNLRWNDRDIGEIGERMKPKGDK